MIHETQNAQISQEQDEEGIYIMRFTYTVEKKENTLIIHSAMQIWKCTIIINFIILFLCPFSKISHSEPSTPPRMSQNFS